MDVAVVPIFGTHGVDVIGSGQIAPVADKVGVAGGEDIVLKSIQIMGGRILHGTAGPGGKVALGVGPGDGLGHRDFANWIL